MLAGLYGAGAMLGGYMYRHHNGEIGCSAVPSGVVDLNDFARGRDLYLYAVQVGSDHDWDNCAVVRAVQKADGKGLDISYQADPDPEDEEDDDADWDEFEAVANQQSDGKYALRFGAMPLRENLEVVYSDANVLIVRLCENVGAGAYVMLDEMLMFSYQSDLAADFFYSPDAEPVLNVWNRFYGTDDWNPYSTFQQTTALADCAFAFLQ